MILMADLDLRSGRTGEAAAHLREAAVVALRTGAWFAALNALNGCGHLCAATGRYAEAVTAWAAYAALYSGPDAPVDATCRRACRCVTVSLIPVPAAVAVVAAVRRHRCVSPSPTTRSAAASSPGWPPWS